MLKKMAHSSLLLVLLSLLIACSSQPNQSAPEVEISPGVSVALPQPQTLGYSLIANQLITATWHEGDKSKSEQLPVYLELKGNRLVLAGFSSWGTRLLSLSYQDDQLQTEVMSGLSGVLPQPEQVLFNLMLTLWPSSTWEAPLNKVEWRIEDYNKRRIITDQQGNKLIEIEYANIDRLSGNIRFQHIRQGYTIEINTLNYQIIEN
ncbi:DUF3261 domain-containing protein [Vibrio hippocampi]|uniref:DUF3261 domain-containing protein n=1 Tax=Vibrio hippocampi TaxID=654686 RepID=A0ABM8ZLX8_9VIBR|nr:DUF3261 domain-containing protein [Vibrio hippocampi]CAH0529163.1 hypothetical protein VHP8226_03082 [Vibrio hippocampi]